MREQNSRAIAKPEARDQTVHIAGVIMTPRSKRCRTSDYLQRRTDQTQSFPQPIQDALFRVQLLLCRRFKPDRKARVVVTSQLSSRSVSSELGFPIAISLRWATRPAGPTARRTLLRPLGSLHWLLALLPRPDLSALQLLPGLLQQQVQMVDT